MKAFEPQAWHMVMFFITIVIGIFKNEIILDKTWLEPLFDTIYLDAFLRKISGFYVLIYCESMSCKMALSSSTLFSVIEANDNR